MINNDTVAPLLEQIGKYDDESAFSQLFDLCFPDLIRFAYSFIQSHSLSEEIASDVLLNIWKKRHELDKLNDFRLYLYVSIRNKSYNQLRKKYSKPFLPIDQITIWSKADTSTPEQLLITAELQNKIKETIQNLPKRCRLIYKLIKEDGLQYKEAATLLDLSVKTIESQMGIALKRLYKVFNTYLTETHSSSKEM